MGRGVISLLESGLPRYPRISLNSGLSRYPRIRDMLALPLYQLPKGRLKKKWRVFTFQLEADDELAFSHAKKDVKEKEEPPAEN